MQATSAGSSKSHEAIIAREQITADIPYGLQLRFRPPVSHMFTRPQGAHERGMGMKEAVRARRVIEGFG
jgi:hypothetical protein